MKTTSSPSATSRPLPLIILAGGDPRPVELPPTGSEHKPLSGFKAVRIEIHGRCLISHVIERFQESGAFDPIVIAGPKDVYGNVSCSVPVIDTNGSIGHNIRVAVTAVRESHPEGHQARGDLKLREIASPLRSSQ